MTYSPLFIKAAQFVLEREGGHSNDAADRGGETRFGVATRSHPDIDLDTLTVEKTLDIYHTDYWQPCRCDQLPARISVALFDGAINCGPHAAIQLLQAPLGVRADGILGPITIAAVGRHDQDYLLNTYLAKRCDFYTGITLADSSQVKFRMGWYSRLFYLQDFISREVTDE